MLCFIVSCFLNRWNQVCLFKCIIAISCTSQCTFTKLLIMTILPVNKIYSIILWFMAPPMAVTRIHHTVAVVRQIMFKRVLICDIINWKKKTHFLEYVADCMDRVVPFGDLHYFLSLFYACSLHCWVKTT